ncbi:hypothetical protein MTR67_030669, partial [Solanum verrucosum]
PLGVLSHPSDGEAWKHFDNVYPYFASEPRNVRWGLSADFFTPVSNAASPYSCWKVFLTPYNLPPKMCMTGPYIFLSCVISRPRNPKGLIDVYLQPLIDELKQLWFEGILTYDISTKKNFVMRASLMWTINDFPTYGMLSGWMAAGKLACCLDRMEENILVVTTKLDKIFPCGFFDVMEHLQIHLVQEARLGGLVQTRWIYPFERKNRPNCNDEGNIDPSFPPISIFNQNGRGSKKCGKRGFTDMEMQSAVTHILLNYPEIQPYVKHHENLGVSQTKHAKKKKSRRPIYPEDIPGSISSTPERISHDTHLFVVLFGTADPRQYYLNYRRLVGASYTSQALPPRRYEDLPLQAIHRPRPLSTGRISYGTPSPIGTSPQLSAMRIGDSSSEQSYVNVSTPPLTQHFVHPGVSPSSTAAPSATPDDEMLALAPGQKDRLGRVMIEPDGSSWHPAKDTVGALKDCVRRLYT